MALFRFTRQAVGAVPADQALVYDVLSDYDAYSEWMPLIAKSKLLAKEGDLAIAEFHLTWPRNCRVVSECVHTKNKMVLGRPIEGKVPVFKVQWDLAPAADGHSQVTLQIGVNASWRTLVPGYRRFSDAKRWLSALRSHLSLFTPEVASPGQEGEKVLEVIESDEGVVVWMRGTKYTLKPGV